MRILITGGGTREPIDGVRFISNFSTGSTSAFLCDSFRERKHDVLFVHARGSAKPKLKGPSLEFSTFEDLDQTLRKILGESQFDAVLHLAAVSDYSVAEVIIDGKVILPSEISKIKSESESLQLNLKRNPKLLHKLRAYSKAPDYLLVGFKLTNGASMGDRQTAVRKLFSNGDLDLVVHNDLTEIQGDSHKATLYRDAKQIGVLKSKQELADTLIGMVEEHS